MKERIDQLERKCKRLIYLDLLTNHQVF